MRMETLWYADGDNTAFSSPSEVLNRESLNEERQKFWALNSWATNIDKLMTEIIQHQNSVAPRNFVHTSSWSHLQLMAIRDICKAFSEKYKDEKVI